MNRRTRTAMSFLVLLAALATAHEARIAPEYAPALERAAARMNASAQDRLAPVYPAMADWVVERYGLAEMAGIGIDLGGGPGDLIVELATRTPALYWINADINTHNFPYLYRKAESSKIAHRIGAVFADAHALPFKENYADIVVSRGTFQFWQEKPTAFGEIYRILKPGAVALIGRGYTENLEPAVAQAIRDKQGDGGPKYEIEETAAELRAIMKKLGIEPYRILVPEHERQPGVKYGIWLEIRKPHKPAYAKESKRTD